MRIEVRGATAGFHGIEVFTNFDATFADRAITALVGPSGSGKSTLMATMAGFVSLSNGQIQFISPDGTAQGPNPSLIAWVPQGSNALSSRTVLDNVMIGPLAEGATLSQAAELARDCLAEVGISPLADRQVRVISGGERQRLGFARALASHKPIIFADEPSASLDAANTHHLAELLTQLHGKTTVVVATHDPLLEAAAENTVHMRDDAADAA
jgi:putative ABC transport system ATP-binding protein